MLCSRVMNLLLQSLGHIVQSYSARRRALYWVLLSTIVFHALQDSLIFNIACKRSSVSAAVFAPKFTLAAPTSKFGTSTSNCAFWSRSNTSASIVYVWPINSTLVCHCQPQTMPPTISMLMVVSMLKTTAFDLVGMHVFVL